MMEIGLAPAAQWYPLSSSQLQMWMIHHSGAVSSAYTVPVVYELSGRLDVDALRRAFEDLVSRNESLRTAFSDVDGTPMQRVINEVALDWRVISETGDTTFMIREFIKRNFDLSEGRLFRVLLLDRSATEHVLVVVAHHIAVDGWSMSVLIDQVATSYRAYVDGQPSPFRTPSLQYKDYAYWQKSRLEQGAFERERLYWLKHLDGELEPLELPADRPRPVARTFEGAVVTRTIAADAIDALGALCKQEKASLFAGLCAVLRTQFYRYTGQRDFVLGTAVLARPVPELYDQIGNYINTIALRDTVDSGSTMRDVVRSTRSTLLEGLRHHEYPFDRVVRQAGVLTQPGRNALFDVMVLLEEDWGDPTESLGDVGMRKVNVANTHSKLDLTLSFRVTITGLQVSAEYSTELFDADRVNRLLAHYETLLRASISAPNASVDTLPLITAQECRQVVSDFNQTETAYQLDSTVPQLFERQVAQTPDATAIVDYERSLTFAQFNEWANQLAWTLRHDHGVGPGSLVAIMESRSVELVVSVLGVLKAGGAYLPIDVNDPAERIAAILDDSGARVVLIRDAADGVSFADKVAVVEVTRIDLLSHRDEDLPPLAGPNDLAYCIYTSGSTGVPKGALIEHRGLVNRLRWMIDDLGLDCNDVILQKTRPMFDVSVWELLLPGIIGAKQVILRPGGESDPAAIREMIERHGVTTLHFVPSMLNQYLAAAVDGFRGVLHCVCSGEALDRDLADDFLAATRDTGTQLYNYYGPAEATVDVTKLRVSPGLGSVTIGRPAANTRIYVLDAGGQPCPVGITGELCIAGIQIGRGYLNRPELTAQRFVDDPFHHGQRMYRTGDRARWLPGGEISFLGRSDEQLKIRGMRIEAGEIEQVLRAQPGVDRAVVLLQDGQHLFAYVAGSDCPSAVRLHEGLSRVLPGYMVPSSYVLVDAIPVTRNGKVDRRALIALGADQGATAQHVAPRTLLERELAEIWRSLLPVSHIGAMDDFFALGGHSLSVLQLTSRIGERFGVRLNLSTILAHRTIAEQARLITDSGNAGAVAPKWTPRPDKERHVLSYAQERMWFLHMLDPDGATYNIPIGAWLDGPLDVEVFRQAVWSLVARHEILRVTFVGDGATAFQIPHADLPLPLEVRDLTALSAEQAREQVRISMRRDGATPFRLEQDAPLRVVLFRVSETEHALLVTLHHIAGDGWSIRLLMRELSVLYQLHSGASGANLEPLALQYIDYARAIRDSENSRAIEADLKYWVDRLTGCTSLNLPTDVPVPGVDRTDSGRASVLVPADIGRRLRALAERTGTTLFEITMSVLSLLLSRLTDQLDVVVGFPVVNRAVIELEGIVGLFLNTLVLRADLSGDPNFTDLLDRVSGGVREAYEHQAAPFELLVERLNPQRRLDRTPVFDVLLNYLGDMREELSIEGVFVEFDEELFELEAKFPLSFYVQEQGDAVHVNLVYRTDLFSPARARVMLDQLCWLLEQIGENPENAIAAYLLVPPGSAAVDLTRPLERPELPAVTELIAARTAESPDRLAISHGIATITYGELVERAEALARHLIELGCRVGDIVGVTGDRGIDFVIGMLGVLRSGATVFPIDPALPAGRKQHLLDIGRPTLLVRADDQDDPITAGLPTVHVSSRTDTEVPLAAVSPNSPAYLFFTTGTTGTPRGVRGWHGALSHFLLWQHGRFAITPEDRCAQLTSASFDVMLRDTFLALVAGGTLVIPEPADLLGGSAVLGWLERERVTVLHAAPTVLQTWLLDAPAGSRLTHLRWVFLAGEPLKGTLVERFRAAYPDSGEIVNLYGPTETTMAKFAYQVPRGPMPSVLPVGLPLPQCQALVLREDVICGVGETGEIVIRTPFRSLGYLHASEATAASFLRNPYLDDENDLLYRTGDLGRFRPDGLLEILGRRDEQVKINGVRTHPVEVENAMLSHRLVATCVVVAHKDDDDEVHLVAYVVAVPASREDPALAKKLRSHAAELLPWAMVPAEFVMMERIPTNSNGKPNRAALPPPLFTRLTDVPVAEAPGDDTERRIQQIWQEVLDRETVGVNQDFFALGGTSLKLLRLYARLEETFPGKFRVAQLFACPTISSQARLVTPARPVEEEVSEYEF